MMGLKLSEAGVVGLICARAGRWACASAAAARETYGAPITDAALVASAPIAKRGFVRTACAAAATSILIVRGSENVRTGSAGVVPSIPTATLENAGTDNAADAVQTLIARGANARTESARTTRFDIARAPRGRFRRMELRRILIGFFMSTIEQPEDNGHPDRCGYQRVDPQRGRPPPP